MKLFDGSSSHGAKGEAEWTSVWQRDGWGTRVKRGEGEKMGKETATVAGVRWVWWYGDELMAALMQTGTSHTVPCIGSWRWPWYVLTQAGNSEETPSQSYPITSPNLCSLNMTPGWRPGAFAATANVKFGKGTGRNVSCVVSEPSVWWNKNMPIILLNNSSASVIWILGGNASYL